MGIGMCIGSGPWDGGLVSSVVELEVASLVLVALVELLGGSDKETLTGGGGMIGRASVGGAVNMTMTLVPTGGGREMFIGDFPLAPTCGGGPHPPMITDIAAPG
jgi:hypothetical protein